MAIQPFQGAVTSCSSCPPHGFRLCCLANVPVVVAGVWTPSVPALSPRTQNTEGRSRRALASLPETRCTWYPVHVLLAAPGYVQEGQIRRLIVRHIRMIHLSICRQRASRSKHAGLLVLYCTAEVLHIICSGRRHAVNLVQQQQVVTAVLFFRKAYVISAPAIIGRHQLEMAEQRYRMKMMVRYFFYTRVAVALQYINVTHLYMRVSVA